MPSVLEITICPLVDTWLLMLLVLLLLYCLSVASCPIIALTKGLIAHPLHWHSSRNCCATKVKRRGVRARTRCEPFGGENMGNNTN